MEIVENKALRLRVRSPERIMAVIPKSHYEGEHTPGIHTVLCHWGYDESLVLKNLGVKGVPSPINKNYKWPGIYTPMQHQRETAEFLTLNPRAFCFDEMGLGKTVASAWAADYLMTLGAITRVLVICPVSIMDAAWRSDLFKSLMHRTVGIAHGERAKRVNVINSGCEFCIINYDGVPRVLDTLKAAKFDLIIMDEGNMVKSHQAARSKAIASLIGAKTRVWLMTGTPAAQSPEDAYGLARLVSPDRVPRSLSVWKDRVMVRAGPFRWIPRINASAIVHEALQPAIRHTAAECLDLPGITYVDRVTPLTKQQLTYYTKIKEQMVATAAGEEITAVNAAALINKLLQLSSGAMYSDTGAVVEFDMRTRLDALEEVIRESTKKVLVFAPFRHTIAMLARDLAERRISAEVISGDVTAPNRARIFKSFQEEQDPQVLIIQPQAAAHGVTLTAASTVVWFGPTTSLDIYLQANARAYRKGQQEKVLVVHLQGSEVERRLYKALQTKNTAHIGLMDLYREILDT